MANKTHQSIRLFKSDFCEWFSHVHPITPLLIWIPVILFLAYRGWTNAQVSAWTNGFLIISAFVSWTLVEYLLHRFIFHFPAVGKLGERFIFIMHGLHHEDPVDPTRLVMPPFASVIIAAILYVIFRALLGPDYVSMFFAAFLAGYLCYDYTHYAVHHFTPRTRFGRYVKQNHMIHHFVNPDARWGVSSPLWDYVFGTYEASKNMTRLTPEQHGS